MFRVSSLVLLGALSFGLLTISPRPPHSSARGRKHYAINPLVRSRREVQGFSARPVLEG